MIAGIAKTGKNYPINALAHFKKLSAKKNTDKLHGSNKMNIFAKKINNTNYNL